eukprot:359925-Chlamydomonas_euryale.AAC.2
MTGPRKVFVYPGDGYVGRNVAQEYKVTACTRSMFVTQDIHACFCILRGRLPKLSFAEHVCPKCANRALQDRGYEVLSANVGKDAPEVASASYTVCRVRVVCGAWGEVAPASGRGQIGTPDAAAMERQFLAMADVVVIELMGHEVAARKAAVAMANQPVRAHVICPHYMPPMRTCLHGRPASAPATHIDMPPVRT